MTNKELEELKAKLAEQFILFQKRILEIIKESTHKYEKGGEVSKTEKVLNNGEPVFSQDAGFVFGPLGKIIEIEIDKKAIKQDGYSFSSKVTFDTSKLKSDFKGIFSK